MSSQADVDGITSALAMGFGHAVNRFLDEANIELKVDLGPRLVDSFSDRASALLSDLHLVRDIELVPLISDTSSFESALSGAFGRALATVENSASSVGNPEVASSAKWEFADFSDRFGMLYAKVSDIKELISDVRTAGGRGGGIGGGDSGGASVSGGSGNNSRWSGNARSFFEVPHDAALGVADMSMAAADFQGSVEKFREAEGLLQHVFAAASVAASVTTMAKASTDLFALGEVPTRWALGRRGGNSSRSDDDASAVADSGQTERPVARRDGRATPRTGTLRAPGTGGGRLRSALSGQAQSLGRGAVGAALVANVAAGPNPGQSGPVPGGGVAPTRVVSSAGVGTDNVLSSRVKATKDLSKATSDVDKAQKSMDKTVKTSAGSLRSVTSATKNATTATKGFNAATRGNPLGLVVTAIDLLISNWGKLGKVFNKVKKKMLDPLAKWVSTMWNEKIMPILRASTDKIGGFFTSMGSTVKGAWDGIVNKIRDVVGFVANVLDKVASVASYIPGAPDLSGVVGKLRDFANGGQKKADGGLLRGPGGPRDDLIPVMASNGEYIVNAAATAENLPLLEAINSGELSWFAGSDRIGEYSSWSDWAGSDVKSAAMRAFFGGKGDAPDLEQIKDPIEKARQEALVGGKTAISEALGTGASGFLGDALGVFGVDRVPPLVQAAMKVHNAMIDQREAAKEASAGSEAELVSAAAQSNNSLLASVSRDAAGLAGLEGLPPLRLPALSAAGGRGNSSVDQSMNITLSTPDIDTAFNKAKTWEAQRALTYTARWN